MVLSVLNRGPLYVVFDLEAMLHIHAELARPRPIDGKPRNRITSSQLRMKYALQEIR